MKKVWTLALLGGALWAGLAAAQAPQPNIVFIMLDDMGYEDVGAYGGTIPTPEIDALAAGGLKFDSYYTNGAVCSPTRASIITGQYPLKFGIVTGVGMDSTRGLPQNEPSLPRLLKEAGYATWHVGKWHLGLGSGYTPCDKGYDKSYRFTREPLEEGEPYIDPEFETDCDPDLKERVLGRHATEVLTSDAIERVKGRGASPFFLSLWYFAPHAPLNVPAPPPSGTMNPERYLPAHCGPVPPTATQREKYEALLCFADFQIGRLVQAIDAAGIGGNTLIIVSSDNGGVNTLEGQVVHAGTGLLTGFKSQTLEGGIRVPMVARWPGTTPVGVDSSVRLSFDWLPTLAELAGADVSGLSLQGESFASLLEGFGGASPARPDLFWEARWAVDTPASLTTAAFNWGAVRRTDGAAPDWKLVVEPESEAIPVPDPYCGFNALLYDLDTDLGEDTDLASQHPGLTDELLNDYLSWRRDVSRFDLSIALLRGTVAMTDANDFRFDAPGVVGLMLDERFEFIDEGSFTLRAQVTPTALGQPQVIAEKEGSWQILLNPSGTVSVTAGSATVESSQQLTANVPHDLAFTLYQRRKQPVFARIFIDGEWEETLVQGGISVTGDPTLIGASSDQLDDPFLGTVADVEFHLVGLYPEQLGGSSCP